ncbi:MAG: DUF2095 family protein [Desulfurococcaceae archaeon]
MKEYDLEEFKKKFPRLAKEMFSDEAKKLELRVEMGLPDPWRGYVPTVVDYIRRCKSVEEALEVIDYLAKRGELEAEEAEELKKILMSNGIEAFGGRKEDDYYYKQARKYWQLVRARRWRRRLEMHEEGAEAEEPT